jgi:hypothetical protein
MNYYFNFFIINYNQIYAHINVSISLVVVNYKIILKKLDVCQVVVVQVSKWV